MALPALVPERFVSRVWKYRLLFRDYGACSPDDIRGLCRIANYEFRIPGEGALHAELVTGFLFRQLQRMSDVAPALPRASRLNPASHPNPGAVHNVTQLLGELGKDDGVGRDELYKAVYGELRAIAARKMASERPGHTLQPTALVHEALLKLGERLFQSRSHFFAAAAEAMRHILVDSARRRSQHKRGGDLERVEFFEAAIAAPYKSEELLMVDEALDTLTREDPLKAEIVKLRYFVGLNHLEIADALEVNEKTVRRHWEVARVRLYQLISLLPSEPTTNGAEGK